MAKNPINSFVPHGYYYDGPSIIELEVNDIYGYARYRITIFNYASREDVVFYGYWQRIRHDKNKRAYIKDWHGNVAFGTPSRKFRPLYLDNFIIKNNFTFITD